MKRFYKEVTTSEEPDGYGILLDGRAVKTPSKKPLVVPARSLAEAIAGEWRAQGEKIVLDGMYLTRLAYGVLELTGDDRAMLREETVVYATTELLCYRDGGHADLLAKQEAQWNPLLDWARDVLGLVFEVTTGIMPVAPSSETMAKAQALVDALDDWQLVPFALLTRILGSLVLPFAVLHGRMNVEDALALSRLEQAYQFEKWGEDVGILQRHQLMAKEAGAVAQFFIMHNGA
jgi:chaperone required for assembly of F1-ATPase